MSGSYSPYTRSGYSEEYSYYQTPSPTPSPRPSYTMYDQHHTQRPATRAHFRTPSHSRPDRFDRPDTTRPPVSSPRFTSDGHYATKSANVSARHSSRLDSPSTPPSSGRHSRRSSISETRSSPHVELYEVGGVIYEAKSLPKVSRRSTGDGGRHSSRRHATDDSDWKQASGYAGYTYARDREDFAGSQTPRPSSHSKRRSSMSVPQRPATARPSVAQQQQARAAAPGAVKRPATEADRLRHKIPRGYSLKNWDPDETPILLLGSVFHADSLGKWIYDWCLHYERSPGPMCRKAGDLWLSLIAWEGKLSSAEDVVGTIRKREDRKEVLEFIEAGERIGTRLHILLKTCEQSMLDKSKGNSSLNENAGVRFVKTLFGPDKELDRTEGLILAAQTFLQRFKANIVDIIENPHN